MNNACTCISLQRSRRADCDLQRRPGEWRRTDDVTQKWDLHGSHYFVFVTLCPLRHSPTPFLSLEDWSPWVLRDSRRAGLFIKRLTYFWINTVDYGLLSISVSLSLSPSLSLWSQHFVFLAFCSRLAAPRGRMTWQHRWWDAGRHWVWNAYVPCVPPRIFPVFFHHESKVCVAEHSVSGQVRC